MIESSPKKSIISSWIKWHFIETPKNLLFGWFNYLKYNIDYFSIPLLVKTLFSHWRMYKEPYPKGLEPTKIFYVFMGNMIARVLGAIVRVFVIAFGIIVEVVIFFGGIIIIFGWLILPFFIILFFWSGVHLLIS